MSDHLNHLHHVVVGLIVHWAKNDRNVLELFELPIANNDGGRLPTANDILSGMASLSRAFTADRSHGLAQGQGPQLRGGKR